jgi:predicted nucleic acid-binding protein
VARGTGLVGALREAGAAAFVADTAPLIFRLERRADPRLVGACDPLFDAVERGELGCLVSTISAAELFVGAFRQGAASVTLVDAFLRGPAIGLVPPRLEVAQAAARLVARRRLARLSDAMIAATALDLSLPLVTADRRLARTGVGRTVLVADFA